MKNKYRIAFSCFIVCGLLLIALWGVFKRTDSGGEQFLTAKNMQVADPITFENITIFPITSTAPRNADRFITLDEGLKSGSVKIVEGEALTDSRFGGGNSVNHLYVINESDHPLYLMPGEIVLGGDQDRMTATEMIIEPSTKPVPIDVYCVEQGRWGNRTVAATADSLDQLSQQTSPSAVAMRSGAGERSSSQLAESANKGEFVASIGTVSNQVRMAGLKSKNQGDVWEKVGRTNQMNSVSNSTSTFSSNYLDKKSVQRLQPIIEHFQKEIAETENVIGVVVAINGKVQSMDAFESTPLFQKLWPKLLKSYALDAVTQQNPDSSTTKCSVADAKAFIHEMVQARSKRIDKATGTQINTKESAKVFSVSSKYQKDPRQSDASESAASVHVSGYSIENE